VAWAASIAFDDCEYLVSILMVYRCVLTSIYFSHVPVPCKALRPFF
jgi:hypothetical protein